jgi:hypothetical protein
MTITAEEVIKSLPALLREKPELRWEIYGLLQEEFVTKTDFHEYMKKSDERFEKLFNELRAFREDCNLRFEEKALITLDKHSSVVNLCNQLGINLG